MAASAPGDLTRWVESLRRLQRQAEAGELPGCARQMLDASREELERALLMAQQIARGFGHAPRQAIRIVCEVPVELELPGGHVAARTSDLSTLGFAVSLPAELFPGEEVAFSLCLPGRRTVKGRARLVTQARNGKQARFRSSFEIGALHDGGSEPLQAFVLDRLLHELTRR